jgi:transposase InsO family protein
LFVPFRFLSGTDHGDEFPFSFVLAVEERGIKHRYIRPRCPEKNGKVERSHRIDPEFWSATTSKTSRRP